MSEKLNKTDFTKDKGSGNIVGLLCGGVGGAILITIIITIFAAKGIFRHNSRRELGEIAKLESLQFYNGLNSEMALSSQMAKSPLIVSYMENPSDANLSKLAFDEIERYQDSFKSHITFWIGDRDLRYYSNGKYVYTLVRSADDSVWYRDTMAMKDDFGLNVDYDIGLKVTNLWVNAIVRNKSGKSIGLIGTGIGLTDFVDQMYKNLDKKYEMVIYNNNYEITGSTNTKYMEDKTQITDVVKDLRLKKNELLGDKERSISTAKAEYYVSPIPLLGWNILIYRKYSFAAFLTSGLIPLVSTLAVFLIIAFIVAIVKLFKPMRILTNTIGGIANGNADLTQRIVVDDRTNVALLRRMVANFNSFIEQLQTIIKSVKTSKDDLVNYGDLLNSSTEDTSSSIAEIKTNIDYFGEQLEKQSDSVEETAGAMHEISANINSLNKVIETQANSVQTASTCVEQMLGNINSVNRSVSQLSTAFNKLEDNANNGVSKQREVTHRIDQIKYQSEALQTANEVISAIAEQTNLLAMNAAIEAAHAGEAGKGFSVVADEIRKLSETSSEQSKTIGEQLTTIQESINSIVDASDETQEALAAVAGDVNDTNQLVQQIENAMEEQKIGSQQISVALGDLNNNMDEVKCSSNEMAAGNRQVLNEVQKLQDATINMKQSMDVMKGSAKKIDETGASLNDITRSLESSIKSIEQQIDQFKV